MKIQWFRFLLSFIFVVGSTSCSTSPLGRERLSFVPDGQMDSMGVKAFQDIKAQTPINKDPKVNAYVQCVALPITRAVPSDTPVSEWEIVVFQDDKQVNAFALPGGKIGVYTGIFKAAQTPGQLAAVLGHEVGHVIAKHGAERMSEQLVAQGGMAALNAYISGKMSDPRKSQILMGLIGAGTQVGVLLPFSRTHESEADLIGIDLMADAGFDPAESITLWENMIKASGKAPPQILSTHPASENRIAALQAKLPEAKNRFEKARSEGRHPECGSLPKI
jgi:predicted Zn-dependent protease